MDFNFAKEIVLENDRVRLQPLVVMDANNLMEAALEDPSIFRYSLSQIKDEASLKNYIALSFQEKAARIRYPFIVFDKKQALFAGSTSFAAVSNKDKRLEIGWTWLGRRFQRTGLNRQVKFLMLQFAFEQLQFERVELKTDERNVQSRTAIENIGGTLEGIFRSHSVMPDGFRRNTVYYSILKNEWPEVKHKLIH